jgi:hypothetical protein
MSSLACHQQKKEAVDITLHQKNQFDHRALAIQLPFSNLFAYPVFSLYASFFHPSGLSLHPERAREKYLRWHAEFARDSLFDPLQK